MDWQNLIVVGIVLAAGVYLTANYIKKRRRKSGCSACQAVKDFKGIKESGSRLPSNRR